MITLDDVKKMRAKKILTDKEIEKMEHCIGFSVKGAYVRSGRKYFKPYRNHFYPGGTDIKVWEHLKELGFADCGKPNENGGRYYWLTLSGFAILSAVKMVYIYSDNSNGNEIDCKDDVLDALLADLVFCGYGCWIPSGARTIAERCRIPLKLATETLHYLQDKCGYVKKTHYGECDDEGFPHCYHGWTLTKKWIDENKERVDAAQKAEYARIEAIEKNG